MKSVLKLVAVGTTTFLIGLSLNGFAYSNVSKSLNIAVVDVQKIIKNYDKITTLRNDQKMKIQDLKVFVYDAQAQVAKENDAAKKKSLEDKLNKELNERKNSIDTDYAQKLEGINKDINIAIGDTAKSQQIDLIIAKSSVLYGGNDVTGSVLSKLQQQSKASEGQTKKDVYVKNVIPAIKGLKPPVPVSSK